ncbi:ABC transporter, putative [Trypanosoma vivax Y486]|uniref:ABC transporter, putative n=1 Tax=Trypanosoma vivax (strain Y486) TaxID=1055687 RepID=F9WUF5_TRYVY|nr:ABC transporter, putative [Trypanosoma vivax Y486]|eukprot:CCD21204.1 ABC transporter, putative [Trypanosoma vivax Y486]
MWFESGIGQDNRYNLLVRHLVLPDITSVLAKSALASLRHSISRETIQTPGFHKLKWMLAAVRNAHRSGRSGARAGGRVLGRGEDYMELVALRMRGLALTVAKEAPSTVSPQDSDEGIETLTRDLLCAVFQTADAMPLLLTAVAALHLSPRFLEQSAQEQDTVMCRLRLFQRVVSQAQFQNAVFFPGGTLREWQADELRVRQSLERSGGSLGCYRIVERMWTVQHQIDRPLASVPPSLDGPWSVEFRDVSFRYGEGRPYVLRNVSFFVNKREFLGIAGCSGAGKTTLLRLLNRTFAPTSGDILINGRHISCYPVRLLRRRVANVWQEEIGLKFLDALTVSQNVALGDLRRCGSTDISSALRSAGALSFLQKRSLGPGTPMHSHKFSGGEVERLSLARAFMKYNTDAGLLVLDEPMSAVDATTERRLFRALGLVERRMPNRAATVVLVTHRLASLRCADTIVILNNGVVDQIGNWTTLCGSGRDSSFSKMLASQQCLASTN